MSDEAKFIEFFCLTYDVRELPMGIGQYEVRCTLIGTTVDYELSQTLAKKLGQQLKIYETEGILHDAIVVLQNDLAQEQQKHADYAERTRVFHEETLQTLSFLKRDIEEKDRELARLRKMEADLERLSGLQVGKVVR